MVEYTWITDAEYTATENRLVSEYDVDSETLQMAAENCIPLLDEIYAETGRIDGHLTQEFLNLWTMSVDGICDDRRKSSTK